MTNPPSADREGPLDAPEREELAIPGVVRVRLRVVPYNSSVLVEAHRAGWAGLYDEPIDHLYWIVTELGVRRKWGKHDHTTDRYAVVQGTVEIALVDGRDESPTKGMLLVITLQGTAGDGLIIPVGVWHTFRAVSPTAVLLNSKTPPYDPGDVDKRLLPMPNDQFTFSWDD